jgi:hypothetical protein
VRETKNALTVRVTVCWSECQGLIGGRRCDRHRFTIYLLRGGVGLVGRLSSRPVDH